MKLRALLISSLLMLFYISAGQAAVKVDSINSTSQNQTITQKQAVDIATRLNEIERQVTDLNTLKVNTIIGFLSGLILALVVSFFSIGWATREVVYKRLGTLTGIERSIVKRNLRDFNKHNNLRLNSRIAVVSKDSEYSESFRKLMRLFNVDVDDRDISFVRANIKNLATTRLLDKLHKFDVVILENITKDKWDINTYDVRESFTKLINNICDKTSFIYFGEGRLELPLVENDKRHLVSFANATSQLYGNLLNMLKYRDELNIKA